MWTQLKADVTGKRITTLDVTEASCLGAAMLACSADTGIALGELLESWVRPVAEVHPDEDRARIYDEKFASYRGLRDKVSEIRL